VVLAWGLLLLDEHLDGVQWLAIACTMLAATARFNSAPGAPARVRDARWKILWPSYRLGY
jgi:hypothetical protein